MRSSSSQEEAPASSQGQYRHRRPCCFGVPSQGCDEKCSTLVSTTQRPEPEPRLGLGAAMAEGRESGGRGGAARPTARPSCSAAQDTPTPGRPEPPEARRRLETHFPTQAPSRPTKRETQSPSPPHSSAPPLGERELKGSEVHVLS